MPPASSPPRRVLGEKDANASLNISSPRKTVTADTDSRSFATTQARARALSGAIHAMTSSPRAGQKRRITEVEGVEAQDWDERVRASQTTDVVSDSASETDQLDTSMLSARSAADTTMTSFGTGPSQENLVEQQFELPEPEMSQKTLDKIHAVALPQNTSQPSQFRDRPELVQNASQDSVGMSTFLNLYSDPSSQASDGLKMLDTSLLEGQEMTEGGRIRTQETSEEDRRKALVEERAAQLRMRLQLAFFKVQTRQTNTPLSRLKIPESHKRQTLSSPVLPAPPAFLHRHSNSMSFSNERMGLSSEARVAALRAQATMQEKPAVASLNSLPVPEIKPTAYSARWTDETKGASHTRSTPQAADSSNNATVHIPSSPPIASHTLHIHEDETATKSGSSSGIDTEKLPSPPLEMPAAKDYTDSPLPSTPPNQSSGVGIEDSDTERLNLTSEDKARPRERRLTNSIVKDEAASGLLQLMRSGVVNAENVRGPMCGL